MNKSILIFDLDGTLVDTMGEYEKIVLQIFQQYPDIDVAQIKKSYIETSGLPFFKQIDTMVPKMSQEEKDKINKEFETKKKGMFESITLEDDVFQTLSELKSRGYKLVISSSTDERLIKHALRQYHDLFDLMLGFRQPDFGKGKPHFEEAMNTFNVTEKDIVFIGDSLNDLRIAAKNNIDFIGKVGTFPEEAFRKEDTQVTLIKNLHELINKLS
jgi:HAD superfamily hydrolase (TIGR01549 family)